MLLHEEQYMYYVAGSNDNIYVQMTTCIIIKASENSPSFDYDDYVPVHN